MILDTTWERLFFCLCGTVEHSLPVFSRVSIYPPRYLKSQNVFITGFCSIWLPTFKVMFSDVFLRAGLLCWQWWAFLTRHLSVMNKLDSWAQSVLTGLRDSLSRIIFSDVRSSPKTFPAGPNADFLMVGGGSFSSYLNMFYLYFFSVCCLPLMQALR